jgi:predicted membrane-bound mannosyltransferase
VLDEAFRRAPARFVGVRIAARSDGAGAHEFLPFVTGFAELALAAALPLLALAAYGAARDRYRPGGPSTAVALHVYWGGAALLVVPVATEVLGPWLLVHAVVPLAVPAAVGAVGLARVLGDAWDRSDPARVVAALLLVAAGAGHAGALYADDVYGAPDADDALAQFAQPADLDPLLANLTAATRDNDGVDVLYFGEALVAADGSDADSPPVPPEWGRRLPLPWYTERAGLETAGARDPAALDATEAPVVVTTPDRRGTVASRLEGRGYAADEYDLALVGRTVVVFVAE